MLKNESFRPNWSSAPGETILDVLQDKNLSMSDFCRQAGLTTDAAKDLIAGQSTITIGVARKLSSVLGAPVQFWMSRDFQYREDVANLDASEEWLNTIPLVEMVKFGWIKAPKAGRELATCLQYFNVSNTQEWHRRYSSMREAAAFRESPSFAANPGATSAWLRQGEIEAESIVCRTWNPVQFRESLADLRSLSKRKNPGDFLPEMRRISAEAGVAVVIVRPPTGCRASGVTRFISKDKAILQLSFRHMSDDHFWFTVFHEAGHLLLHGETRMFLEGVDRPGAIEEDEADQFAESVLIPPGFKTEFATLRPTMKDVIRFAVRVGIAPGIIVGQLQHARRIRHGQMNYLKRRYVWAD